MQLHIHIMSMGISCFVYCCCFKNFAEIEIHNSPAPPRSHRLHSLGLVNNVIRITFLPQRNYAIIDFNGYAYTQAHYIDHITLP